MNQRNKGKRLEDVWKTSGKQEREILTHTCKAGKGENTNKGPMPREI